MNIKIRQGKGGRWRWLLYDNDKFEGVSKIRGWATRQEAERAAKDAFGSAVELFAEEGPVFAGQRDWSD